MKLSEAIRLGAMLKPQNHGFGAIDSTCALEAACEATGLEHWSFTDRIWPWLQKGVHCPVTGCTHPSFTKDSKYSIYRDVVYHLNDYHYWTRERIAYWVSLVEPNEDQIVDKKTLVQANDETSIETLNKIAATLTEYNL